MLLRMSHNLQLNHEQIKALLQRKSGMQVFYWRFNFFFTFRTFRTRGFINSEKWNAYENVIFHFTQAH